RGGASVTVVEQGAVGAGCSHANCGYVCPSHVLPLAGPGMIGKALRVMLKRNSPLTIRPRLDPALWGWLLRFARRCNVRDMLSAGRAIKALLDSSRALYDELVKAEALEVEWEERGLLFVFRTPREMEHYAHTDEMLRREYGLAADRIDAARLAAME